jgi:hypothetical protein
MVNISITEDELLVICNSLNEVCNGIDVEEFDARMGTSPDNARRLLGALSKVVDTLHAEDSNRQVDRRLISMPWQ